MLRLASFFVFSFYAVAQQPVIETNIRTTSAVNCGSFTPGANGKIVCAPVPANWLTIKNAPFTDPRRYNWVQTPSTLLGIGSNVITLNPMPEGLTSDCINLCLVSILGGIGTGESAPIIAVGVNSITVTCLHTHVGSSVGSNSSGIQEAIIVANVDGAVRMFSGISTLWGNLAPSGTYPNGIAAVTIPGQWNTSLYGYGRYATTLYTVGTTGDWIRYECVGPCTSGSGGAGSLVGFAMYDSGGTVHTSGAMIRLRYTADFYLDDLWVNQAWDGIYNEGGIRFIHSNFTVGTSHFGYAITCKNPVGVQANFPACLSYGQIANPFISSATSGTHAIHVEAPTAGVYFTNPNTGSASNSNNVSFFTTAIGTNPWNEIGVTDGTFDGHQIGIEAVGNGSTYTSNSLKFASIRINAAQYAIFAFGFVEALSAVGCDLNGVGAGGGASVIFNGDVRRSQILNSPQMGSDGAACFQIAGVATDIDFNGNVCGRQTLPASGLALGGTITNFNVKGNWLSGSVSGAAGIVATSATITGLHWSGNTGSVAWPVSTVASCGAANVGETFPFSDSTVNTWGTAISGSGANTVLGWCNGSNWTVYSK